jgi:hypothetical protein
MPSPFPGMNPYLEQEAVWHDFHKRFIPSAASILGGQLRPRYIVKIVEDIHVNELAVDHERLSYVEIRDRRDRELVTVVELLSPSNKHAGPDREQYLAKRMEFLNTPVHLVEIDLLRGGPPLPAAGRPKCSYSVLVSRVERRLDAEFWPILLRERLPVIPVPVRSPDPYARLDLQAVLDRIYDDAGYADYIYEASPRPRLSAKDADWARQFLP